MFLQTQANPKKRTNASEKIVLKHVKSQSQLKNAEFVEKEGILLKSRTHLEQLSKFTATDLNELPH